MNNENDGSTYGTALYIGKPRQHFGHNSVQEDKKYRKIAELSLLSLVNFKEGIYQGPLSPIVLRNLFRVITVRNAMFCKADE